MTLIPQGAFLDERPFGLPAVSCEIHLDLPLPPSTNRLHAHRRGHVYKTKQYNDWIKQADALVLLKRQYPKNRIEGRFEIEILIDDATIGDGDNRIKSCLDYLQSREIIKNDKDCRKGRWAFVPTDQAPHGCRVHLRSLHDA